MKGKTLTTCSRKPEGYERVAITLREERHRPCVLGTDTYTKKCVIQPNDRTSARSREIKLRNSVGIWVQNVVATLVILSFVGLLFCVLYRENDLANKDIFNILLGILGTVVVQIFQYWFGASASTSGESTHVQRKN